MCKISFIVVNYNSSDLLLNLLDSLFAFQGGLDFEVIVFDNGSKNFSVEAFEKYSFVKVISNEENLGFAKANNLAVKFASGEILFFINPDTKILEESNFEQVKEIQENTLYTTRITDANSEPLKTVYLIPTIKDYLKFVFSFFFLNFKPGRWAQGSAIIMTKGTFAEIGGWPEDYFMYCEDLDLCYTALKKGIGLKILPISIFHACGGTTERVWSNFERLTKVELSFYKFCKKHSLVLDYHVIFWISFFRLFFKDLREAFLRLRAYFTVNLKVFGKKVGK